MLDLPFSGTIRNDKVKLPDETVSENPARSCKNCRFSVAMPNVMVGQWGGQCRGNCPQLLAVPVVSNGMRQLQISGVFPPVSEKEWCYRFEPKAGG